MNHISADRQNQPPTPEEQEHLDGCVRCRIDRRLLEGKPEPLRPIVMATLSSERSSFFSSLGGTMYPDGIAPPEVRLPPFDPGRYEIVGRIGMGGMAHVERVHDHHLGRSVAMKVAREKLQSSAPARARFISEARIGAQLQHPGIVAVHELGVLDDGRPAFTMKEVMGRTLQDLLTEWPLRRMLEAHRRVCETVAYAHSRGVSHRDLKPENVMLGEWGEVVVLDWGLAKVGIAEDHEDEVDTLGPALQTRAGSISGTPAYMAPEQARGEVTAMGTRTDVYGLGAILYAILTGGPPYDADSGYQVVAKVILGPPEPPTGPEALVALCQEAMEHEIEARTATAQGLAAAIGDWLDGAHRRERALAALERASSELPKARVAEAHARALREDAVDLSKHERWAAEDAAAALEERASVHRVRFTQGVQGALTIDPELDEAHRVLASHWRAEHEAAEAARRPTAALEVLLRTHDRGEHIDYLRGVGTLSFDSTCELFRYERVNRRQHAISQGTIRPADHELPIGSYLLRAGEVDYPVHVERDSYTVVEKVAPGLGCVVPGGWFARESGRAWVDTFVIARDPVTHRDYLEFLNAIDRDEALKHAPRERSTRPGELGGLLVDCEPAFTLREDAEGDRWHLDWPVWMVSWHDAIAYAEWKAEQEGVPWRLPWSLEWEKAARGVDGRTYPWGDFVDPTWACIQGSHDARPMPSPIGSHPIDESPYGVRGMAGNLCDWTMDLFRPDGPPLIEHRFERPEGPEFGDSPQREVRGGSWCNPVAHARAAFRDPRDATDRRWVIGFRLAYSSA